VTPLEEVDLALTVAVERFNKAIIAWNYDAAVLIQQTKDDLLDRRWALTNLGVDGGPQEAA
jgi:hypothetical protein